MSVMVKAIGDRLTLGRPRILLILLVLAIAARAEAQLPDAPSAIETAPLKRYSLNVGLENTYSLNTSLLNLTPKLGLSMRIGERETLGVSYSHANATNHQLMQNNTVVAWLTFRVCSWGKIPRER